MARECGADFILLFAPKFICSKVDMLFHTIKAIGVAQRIVFHLRAKITDTSPQE